MLADSSLTDARGFSDGEKIFIRHNRNFPLLQEADNFTFYAFNKITLRRPLKYAPPLVIKGDITDLISDRLNKWTSSISFKKKDIQLFHLSMETGRVC